MMNKKGFTLVELMVVIVIIGVLAAVALPKFAEAINKSRASEAPQRIKQIYSAAVVYEGENATYVVSAAGGTAGDKTANATGAVNYDKMGISSTSKFFSYHYDATTTLFTAAANPKENMGDLLATSWILMIQDGTTSYSGNWKKYAAAFLP